MDALIKSIRPAKASEIKASETKPADGKEAKLPDMRPAELDPAEFLAAAVRADQPRPSRAEAEAAVHTLLGYIGENPGREGLLDTPRRVVEAFDELYQGYHQSPAEVLTRTFGETAGYDDFVLIRDIEFTSQCEHHMMPFYGKAHIALYAGGAGGGAVEAGAADRYLCPPPADAGTSDRPDRRGNRRGVETPAALR